jgi:hypothetical protein
MFDAVTIRRMERVVLGALEWCARSVTSLAFLAFLCMCASLCPSTCPYSTMSRPRRRPPHPRPTCYMSMKQR